MRRCHCLLALLFLVPPAVAAEPTVEIRVKSVNDLVGHLEYFGGIVNKADEAKQFAGVVKAFTNEKGLAGLDVKRPLGAYAVLTPAMIDSQIVVLIPVADEETLLGTMKSQLALNPKKGADGVYSVDVPNVPPKVFFTFFKGYACVTVFEKSNVDAEKLHDPKAFFAADDSSLAAVQVHIDRIPAEVRKTVLGQFELKMHDEAAKKNDADSPAAREAKGLLIDGAIRAVRCLFDEGRTANLKLLVEPKSDRVSLAFGLTAVSGSDLKSTLAAIASRPAVAVAAAAVKNPIASLAAKVALPEAMKKPLAGVVDKLINEAVANAKADDKDAVGKIFDTLAPTLKSGDYAIGAALTGPGEGKLNLIVATKATEGREVEKLAKEFAQFIPEDKGKLTFDVAKLSKTTLHKVTIPHPDLTRIYGTDTVWTAIGDELVVLGFEAEATATKATAEATAVAGDMLHAEVGLVRLMALVETGERRDAVAGFSKQLFGGMPKPGSDAIVLSVKGGESLNINLSATGKALGLFALMGEKK